MDKRRFDKLSDRYLFYGSATGIFLLINSLKRFVILNWLICMVRKNQISVLTAQWSQFSALQS
jgi:hypothetical protein